MATTSTDVSALSAYAGTHQNRLITSMINSLDVAQDLFVMPNIKNKERIGKLKVLDGARPYSSDTEFKKALQYIDRFMEVRVGKRELLIDVEDYRRTYLAEFMQPGSGAPGATSRNAIPFAAYTWQKVIEALAAELNDKTAWAGFDKDDAVEYDAGDAYAVGDYVTFAVNSVTEYFKCIATASAGDTPATDPDKWVNVTAEAIVPGIKYWLDDAIDNEGLPEVATGVINSGATALAAFKKLFRACSDSRKKKGIIIRTSYTDYEYLLDGIEDSLKKYTNADVTDGMAPDYLFLPGTNRKCIVKPATWMANTRRLIAEPLMMMNGKPKGENLRLGTDLLGDLNGIKTKENLWTLEAGIKFVLGFQIADLNELWVGNQE